MRVLGYFLVTVGIVFGVYMLIAIIGMSVAPADLKGEKQSYIIGHHFGIVVAMVLLAALDFALIWFGKKLIKKAKTKAKIGSTTTNETGK